MGDHAGLMSHLIDPSERSLVETAHEFSEDFDALLLQSNDFASMLSHNDNDVPSFGRFLQDVQISTRQLRDFKRAVKEMIAQCKLVGLIPELLADHVRREAEHFLMILAMMEKGIIKCVTAVEPECEDVEAMEDIGMEEEFCAVEPAEFDEAVEDCECHDDEEDGCDEEYCDDHQTKFEMYKSPTIDMKAIEDDIDDDCDCPAPKASLDKQKPPKYKWGGKWPRPL
jgi:hypothetical protein